MARRPMLSIVVTSYTTERLKDIFELLDSIKAQTYPNIEIVFVAERSRELYDKVKEFISQQSAIASPQPPLPEPQSEVLSPESIRRAAGRQSATERGTVSSQDLQTADYRLLTKVIFNDGEPGMSAARNLGINQARGDIIAFVDDDALLFPDWAEEMVKTYEDDSVIGVTGPILALWKDESMGWFPDEFDWILSCAGFSGIAESREVRNVWGANMSFKREAFDLAGVFSSAIGAIQGRRLHGEEVELSLRVKTRTKRRIVCNPAVRVKHKVYKYRLNSRFIARSSYWIGYTKHGLEKLYPDGDEGKSLLGVEHQLLRRILTKLLPNILGGFFRKPIVAWRKLRVTTIALFFVALGYYSHLLPSRFSRRKEAK